MEGFAKIVEGYNYFSNISFSRFLLYEINITNFLNTGLIFTTDVFILCKKIWRLRGPGNMYYDLTSHLQLFIKEQKLLHKSFFQNDFVSKLNETMKLVRPMTSTSIFLRKDEHFV